MLGLFGSDRQRLLLERLGHFRMLEQNWTWHKRLLGGPFPGTIDGKHGILSGVNALDTRSSTPGPRITNDETPTLP